MWLIHMLAKTAQGGPEKRARGDSADDAPPLVTRGETAGRRTLTLCHKVVILPARAATSAGAWTSKVRTARFRFIWTAS